MAPLSRVVFRAPLARVIRTPYAAVPRRWASSDYGSVQGGQDQGINQDNPKKHLEHPGPEPPSTKTSDGSATSSDSKDGASPKISQPKSANEDQNEDVKKHNEEMAQRSEKTSNQLGEEDNKVDKKFWKGDVGDKKTNDS